MKRIGPHFFYELQLAELVGLRFSWGDDGSIEYADEITPEQRAAVTAVLDAHDPDDLGYAKRAKLEALTTSRNAALAALAATWDGDEWDANEETSNRISSILTQLREAQELGVVVPPQIPWRTADNQTRMLTIQELAAMGLALLQAQQLNIWSQNTALKDAVIAATTLEEVEAINWPQ